jgi:hypothetical protein
LYVLRAAGIKELNDIFACLLKIDQGVWPVGLQSNYEARIIKGATANCDKDNHVGLSGSEDATDFYMRHAVFKVMIMQFNSTYNTKLKMLASTGYWWHWFESGGSRRP